MAGIEFCVRLFLATVIIASSEAFLSQNAVTNDLYDISGDKMTSPMVKRMPELSINQDLRTLANMLIMREYARAAEMRKNRELLAELGKRSADESSSQSKWAEDDAAGSKGSYDLANTEDWKEDSAEEKAESNKGRRPSLTLWRILSSS